MKEYTIKKAKGLLSTQQLSSYADMLVLSSTEDGNVHFGKAVMLKNVKTSGVLATDLGDKLRRIGEVFAVTTTSTRPCARNVFMLKSYSMKLDASDDVLRYGEKFHILTTPHLTTSGHLRSTMLYLSSQIITPDVYSKYSHFQEVCTSGETNYSTVWQVLHYDPKVRLENEGSPVEIGASIVIQHCQTGANLGSDIVPYRNDFGIESEVFCHTIIDQHKAEMVENIWVFEDQSLRFNSPLSD